MGKKGNKFNADEYLGRNVVWKAPLIWFMDAPYQGRIVEACEENNVIKVWIKLDRGGYFGWCKLSDFSFMK